MIGGALVSVEIRKVLKYPPEAFLYATPFNLLAGDNKVSEYSGFDPYVLVIQGLSFAARDGLVFHADVDGFTDVVRLDNLASVRGLDFEEGVKFATTRRAIMRITATTSVSGYAWRHRVVVFEPTVSMKLQLGLPLTQRDSELAEKFGLRQALKTSVPKPYDLYEGVEELKTVSAKLTSSGTVTRVIVPKGKKIVLLGVAAARPSAPASAYLNVSRDNVDALSLDLYCLPSLSYEAGVRVVALEKLEATLDVRTAGDYYVRLVYGVGRLTLREKVMWGLDLTPDERALAEEQDLFDKVEAGVT
jgi:hypothetical protein